MKKLIALTLLTAGLVAPSANAFFFGWWGGNCCNNVSYDCCPTYSYVCDCC